LSLKSSIEAILFLTDKPLRAQAIARIINQDVQIVRQSVLELIHDYETRETGLEISDDDGYMIQVKDEYASIIDEFVPMELPTALIRTLSAIAIKQPVPQSEIIKIRGAGAYDHVKELIERELIAKKEDGRSPLLTTTKKFQEYFRLSRDAKGLRDDLKSQIDLQSGADGAVFDASPGEMLPLDLLAKAEGVVVVPEKENAGVVTSNSLQSNVEQGDLEPIENEPAVVQSSALETSSPALD
jgi:segregation and condensation protein B